eukprot:1629813-Amphidinium_carterae.1
MAKGREPSYRGLLTPINNILQKQCTKKHQMPSSTRRSMLLLIPQVLANTAPATKPKGHHASFIHFTRLQGRGKNH